MALPARVREPLVQWGIAVGIEGTTLYAVKRLLREARKNGQIYDSLYKNMKQWTEPILLTGISLVAYILVAPRLRGQYVELAVRIIRAVGDLGVMKAWEQGLKDEPFLVVNSSSEIEVFNLDADANVKVYIDGSEVTFQTAPKTDANGYAKITLPSAMSTGTTHKILVHTGFKAVYDEVYVS
ncbi:MAG: hypothetical protein DRO40_09770 [Thermoprotei archaeon]|nr:MAG: hypothetical protein DRO40_09770 [Thermoprotei archaeon]